jgi:hypothetical protein
MSTLRTITGFKERLAGGGARPNLFEVALPSFPGPITDFWKTAKGEEADTFNFLCKAAALPASNVNFIPVPFRGRIMKVAGDRTFDPWRVTIINDEDFQLRTAFELWMNSISRMDTATGFTSPNAYMTDAYVYQLGRGAETRKFSERESGAVDGSRIPPLKTYKFYDIFPTNVSEIALSYESADQVEQFDVEFQVQWWSAGEGQDNGDQTETIIK